MKDEIKTVEWDFGEHNFIKDLIVSGKKLATTGLLKPATVIPQIGEVVWVSDNAGDVFAKIKYTKIDVKPFLEVDYEYAKLEGEGDQSIEEWRQKHREFFKKYYPEFNDESMVVCYQFELAK